MSSEDTISSFILKIIDFGIQKMRYYSVSKIVKTKKLFLNKIIIIKNDNTINKINNGSVAHASVYYIVKLFISD